MGRMKERRGERRNSSRRRRRMKGRSIKGTEGGAGREAKIALGKH